MRYTVTSAPGVDDALALIWLQASDRTAVSRAAHQIDAILRSSPLTQGTAKGDHRVLTVEPLTVVYTVSPDDCQVSIQQFIYHG